MEAGLHVTLLSLLTNLSDREAGIKIYLFLEGFSNQDLNLLRATLDGTGANYEIILGKISLESFKGFRSFHGTYMTYARLILPDIMSDEERILYLDSDLVVCTDVSALFQVDMQNLTLAAVGGGLVGRALDGSLFLKNGFCKEDPYFNAGVLLFNATKWRKEDMTQKCLAFCKEHGRDLISHDQSVLNFFFSRNHFMLDQRFNTAVYPDSAKVGPQQVKGKIIHFLGAPKPWDFFGRHLHNNYDLYNEYYRRSALKNRFRFSLGLFLRTLRLARSYYICFKKRLKR